MDEFDTQTVIGQFRDLADALAAAAQSTIEPSPISVPSTWGSLEIIRQIGRGAYGTVYLAWESTLERTVALKLLHNVDRSSAAIREGRMLALAEHPNVVRVLGVDEHDGFVGLWMEFIDGVTLKQFLERNGALSAQEASHIGICLCQSLTAVHQAGLVHRDIKAHNVMREDRTGRIVLMDFGSSAVRRDDPPEIPNVVGTPLYIAPELLTGSPATIASDIYSLGVVLYQLMTLAFPVPVETLESAQGAHDCQRFVPLSERRPDVQPAFISVVSRALARDPAHRYETVGAMQEDLIRAVGLDMLTRQGAPAQPLRHDKSGWLAVPPFFGVDDHRHVRSLRDGLVQKLIETSEPLHARSFSDAARRSLSRRSRSGRRPGAPLAFLW